MVSRPNIHPQNTSVRIIFYACPRFNVKIICRSLLGEVPAVIDRYSVSFHFSAKTNKYASQMFEWRACLGNSQKKVGILVTLFENFVI
jgi:hypothetical protein